MNTAANDGVLRCLRSFAKASVDTEPVQPIDPKRDYYWGSGTHPDVLERLWNQIGKELPVDSRALVYGKPALVHPESGTVLAFALGTEYAIRLPAKVWADQRPSGLRTVAKWAGGSSTDLATECGKDWIFGSYTDKEVEWCKQAFQEHSSSSGL
jgi:hypothetical protein